MCTETLHRGEKKQGKGEKRGAEMGEGAFDKDMYACTIDSERKSEEAISLYSVRHFLSGIISLKMHHQSDGTVSIIIVNQSY